MTLLICWVGAKEVLGTEGVFIWVGQAYRVMSAGRVRREEVVPVLPVPQFFCSWTSFALRFYNWLGPDNSAQV